MDDTVHVVCPDCNMANRLPRGRLGDGAKCGRCKNALMPHHPYELTAANFDRHVNGNDLPLVVDFWAPWGAPCRTMAPAYEQAADRLAPRVRLAKLNTEAEPALAARFGIRSIPTLVAFEKGREVARQSGAMDLNGLVGWINNTVK